MTQEIHPSFLPLDRLLEQCKIKRTRGGGPGGQHRNKVETAIVITHEPSGVVGRATEKRSQNANREVAIKRLRVNLALQVRCKPQDELSELWVNRSSSGKVVVNPDHVDFPALLAEALNVLAGLEFDVVAAAKGLGVSTSQFVKFLKLEPLAFQHVNQKRVASGLRALK